MSWEEYEEVAQCASFGVLVNSQWQTKPLNDESHAKSVKCLVAEQWPKEAAQVREGRGPVDSSLQSSAKSFNAPQSLKAGVVEGEVRKTL